jgi:hypothetical protein
MNPATAAGREEAGRTIAARILAYGTRQTLPLREKIRSSFVSRVILPDYAF